MRTDILSKRMFTAGCFGLPWLWIVHTLYWRQILKDGGLSSDQHADAQHEDSNPPFLNPDDYFQEEAAVEATTEEIQMMASKWVKRSQYSATVVMTGWLAWIIASQVLRHFHLLPAALFMHNADDADLTGW